MWYKGAVFILDSVLWGKLYLEIKPSNMHTYKLQIYILWQEWNNNLFWGVNRENMANYSFAFLFLMILKYP